jgi:hypothetical protein
MDTANHGFANRNSTRAEFRHGSPDVLVSWNEIAAYLGKGVRTVQRWEVELALPVHRPVPGAPRMVITTKNELADWLAQQHTRAQARPRPIADGQFARMKLLVQETHSRAEQLQENAAKFIVEFENSRAGRVYARRKRLGLSHAQ